MNKRLSRLVAGTLLLGATAFAAPSALAQDEGFGAYVYEGTCEAVENAQVVTELGTLHAADENEDIAEQWQTLNQETDALPRELKTAEANLSDDVTVESLLDESHVVAVHAEETSDSEVIVCGKLIGNVDDPGILFIDLPEANDSNFEGRIAFSTEADEDSDVTIGVFTEDEAQELASPEAATPIISSPVAAPEGPLGGTPVLTPVATPSS